MYDAAADADAAGDGGGDGGDDGEGAADGGDEEDESFTDVMAEREGIDVSALRSGGRRGSNIAAHFDANVAADAAARRDLQGGGDEFDINALPATRRPSIIDMSALDDDDDGDNTMGQRMKQLGRRLSSFAGGRRGSAFGRRNSQTAPPAGLHGSPGSDESPTRRLSGAFAGTLRRLSGEISVSAVSPARVAPPAGTADDWDADGDGEHAMTAVVPSAPPSPPEVNSDGEEMDDDGDGGQKRLPRSPPRDGGGGTSGLDVDLEAQAQRPGAAAGGGSDRSKSTSGPTGDAKPVASSMSAEAQLAGGYEATPARPGLARSRTQPLVAHERVTPVRAPRAR